MTVVHHGYQTVRAFSTEPAGGVTFSLRVGFGDLHREVDLAEVFAPAPRRGRDR